MTIQESTVVNNMYAMVQFSNTVYAKSTVKAIVRKICPNEVTVIFKSSFANKRPQINKRIIYKLTFWSALII